ncbi:MAG TPA: hypothetical protein VFE52_11200 [Devosia sp.]|jgi:hypothetical protein|nr:hypothetical protein [Devosia sp.]
MSPLFTFFSGEHAVLMASVVAFTAFFLIGRLVHARPGVALAFGLTPWLALLAIAGAMVALN